mgnify:CR=1 FL=1
MLNRYDPWIAMRQLRNDMNRAIVPGGLGHNDDSSDVVTSGWTPAVDIEEKDDKFVIRADVPGVDPKDIEVTLESQSEGEEGYRRVERAYGSFYRRFSLPDTADADGVSAASNHGVLEVVIPKRAAVQPKRITVAA